MGCYDHSRFGKKDLFSHSHFLPPVRGFPVSRSVLYCNPPLFFSGLQDGVYYQMDFLPSSDRHMPAL